MTEKTSDFEIGHCLERDKFCNFVEPGVVSFPDVWCPPPEWTGLSPSVYYSFEGWITIFFDVLKVSTYQRHFDSRISSELHYIVQDITFAFAKYFTTSWVICQTV